MLNIIGKRHFLLGGSLIAVIVASQSSLAAQDKETETNAQEHDTAVESSEFLGTIVLGESKRTVKTETAVPVTVLDQVEINDRQASTIAELIDSVPGVTLVNGSSPAGSGINIRGFGANGTYGTDQKVAIIVDGATTGSEELYRIGNQLFTDPYLYKSAEVIRGTVGSFEYGSGIVGGTVRLQTKDASDFTAGETGFKLALTGGAYTNEDGLNGSAIVAWQPTKNLELLANVAYREQGNQHDGDGEEIGNSKFDLPSYLLKARYTFGESHSLSASYTQSNATDRDVPYDSFGTTGGSFGNVDRDTKTQTASFVYNYNPQENQFINLDLGLTYANQEIEQDCIEASAPFGCFAVVDADHKYETTKLTMKNYAFLETGALSHELRTGVELLQKDRLDANSAPGGTDKRLAFFVVDQIEFGQGWSLTPALRYETQKLEGTLDDGTEASYDNDAIMGGASLRYQFQNGFAVFGSLARTESLPILDDIENPVYSVQSEIADTYELGASYDRNGIFTAGDALALKATYYNTDLSDVTSYSGVSDIEISGFELEGSLAFKSGFYIDLNANITSGNESRTTGEEVDWRNTPADQFRATIGQRLSTWADVSFEAVKNADTTRTSLGTSGVVTTETSGFTVLNLRMTITPQTGLLSGTQIRLGAENLTDELYMPLLATRTAPGRNFKLTISHVF
ncbi:TonB-dependent receptor domain-containing protein [Kordiimonas sp.]|uniref:TonB-dependent receptor domain-containing protein n=1 Tax=Kordiimonas sp. TaxID=1970157 RepID=UPI003A938A24